MITETGERVWLVEGDIGVVHDTAECVLYGYGLLQVFDHQTLDAMRPVLRACDRCMKEGLPDGND